MKAVIMAGGEGKRLRPLTCDRPKPMVYVANRPIMEHIVNLLKRHNIDDIAVTLQYMPNNIKEYFSNGESLGVDLRYYTEDTPLGTAGSVKNVGDFLDETFVVISGDVLTDIDITEALKFHKEKKAVVTIVLKSVPIPLEYGVVITDDDGRIKKFLEKPNWGEVFSDTVNTGIYILDPKILSYIDSNKFCDFGKDIFPMLLQQDVPLYGYITNKYWCDVGDVISYRHAHKDILDKKVYVEIQCREIAPDIWVGNNVCIDTKSEITAPCIIGDNTKIGRGVHIDKYTVIGNNNIIGENSTLKQSVVWNNSDVGSNVGLRGTVVANNVVISDNVCLYEGSVIGSNVEILDDVVVKPDVKIWPHKRLDRLSVLSEDLVWGTKYTKNIFGERGIHIGVIPEYITKLGLSYGSFMKSGSRIAVVCSNSNISRLAKMAFLSGLLRTGVTVLDFGELLVPMLMSAVRFYKLDGGIYINDVRCGSECINIEILNKYGCNIESADERKIENICNQKEFVQCNLDSIKPVASVSDYVLFYAMDMINNISCRNISLNIVVNTNSSIAEEVLTKIFEYMGCTFKFVDLGYDQQIFTSFVVVGKFDLGIEIDDRGESFVLVDSVGRVIDRDKYKILVILIQLMNGDEKIVVAPTTTSGVVDKLAHRYGGKVKRTKSSVSEIMKEMQNADLREQFSMYFDAIYGIVNVLKFMKENKYTSKDLYDIIPKFYMSKTEVSCKTTDKGKIIKNLMKEKHDIDAKEGVKIYTKDGWALVLPNVNKASVNIISEGINSEVAEEICGMVEQKIQKIING